MSVPPPVDALSFQVSLVENRVERVWFQFPSG